MRTDPAALFDLIRKGDVARLGRALEPRKPKEPDMTRLTADAGDVLELMLNEDAAERLPSESIPEEDRMPDWEMEIRQAILKVSEASDHEARAIRLKRVADLCLTQEAREWKLATGAVRT